VRPLGRVSDAFASVLMNSDKLLRGGIVEFSCLPEEYNKKLVLLFIRAKSVLVSAVHLGSCSLRFNVLFDRLFGKVTHTSDIVRPAPKSLHTRSQMNKFLAKNAGSVPLEWVSSSLRCFSRVSRHKKVNVVRHDLQCFNNDLVFLFFFYEAVLSVGQQHHL
jgi:hypothetical protein